MTWGSATTVLEPQEATQQAGPKSEWKNSKQNQQTVELVRILRERRSMNGYSIESRLGGPSSPSRGEGKYALIYDAMLLLSFSSVAYPAIGDGGATRAA